MNAPVAPLAVTEFLDHPTPGVVVVQLAVSGPLGPFDASRLIAALDGIFDRQGRTVIVSHQRITVRIPATRERAYDVRDRLAQIAMEVWP